MEAVLPPGTFQQVGRLVYTAARDFSLRNLASKDEDLVKQDLGIAAEVVKLARVPFFVSAVSVNCGTSNSPPPISRTLRFMRPSSSGNTR